MKKEEGTVICGELRPSGDLGGVVLAGNDKHGEHHRQEDERSKLNHSIVVR